MSSNNKRRRIEGYESPQKFTSTTNKPESIALTHDDYTVGWICALSKEQTAATVMLDNVHPDLPKPLYDQNTYTLGCIGKHNVVIACLPKGQYATIPAAKVATWMMGTFPSIRLGLVVGIGGGIPPIVRLGDVVVSTPTAEYPGVVQWDMGKAEAGGHFRRTGSLNNPPTALLTALTKLETQHDMHGTKIPQYLDDVRERFPQLASKYTASKLLQDPSNNLGEHKNMQVHYGLIASGNQVIKDEQLRDRLNKDLGGNVLCVEMEAAGLMNDFPCVVIRGICDYADSKKNKDWQEYAALVAAAYAKELLGYVLPEHAALEKPIRDIVGK
jgi:nucleoside phosphorylase